MALTAAEKRKKMQEVKKKLADKRAKANVNPRLRAKNVEANRNKRKVAYQEKLAKKKTGVSGTKVNTNKGKMSANDKVGPSHLGRSNPQKKKSTADKTSVVNKATTGQQSEKTAPNMSRSTKKIGSVAKGNETYNKGPAMLKSKEDKKKSAARLKAGKKTVKAKPRYRARATMTGFGR
tara:strand:+ start:942 stop:1475 length:534 start_codon:yes stop_codon:yes gene_type:complete